MPEPQADSHAQAFPWHLGVHDAHCHPTDTMSSIAEIPHMKASTLAVMSTRGEDQDLVMQTAQSLSQQSPPTSTRIVPCFGWHPWFSHQILNDIDSTSTPTTPSTTEDQKKTTHYQQVLTPSPPDSFISTLPHPIPLSHLITSTRTRLTTSPSAPIALLGEVGLDRAFRLPSPWTETDLSSRDATKTPGSREGRTLSPYRVQLEHQKAVLAAQLRLAGEVGCAASVHSVQAHGAVLDVFRGLWRGFERRVLSKRERKQQEQQRKQEEEGRDGGSDGEGDAENAPANTISASTPTTHPLPFPPRICMHSYSGPVEQTKQFLSPSNPSDIYFSFSTVINMNGPTVGKVVDVIKALPADRILIESDLHTAGQVMDELLEQVARQICELRGWGLEEGVAQLARNWRRFAYGKE